MNFLIFFALLFSAFAGLEIKQIVINNKKLKVEIASTNEQREVGLMNRTSMGENEGMLFVFEFERPLGFWMKNTKIPLSIGYFDKNKKLIDILDMEPPPPNTSENELKVYKSSRPAQYALEVNKGWFKKHKIKLNSEFSFEKKQ